VSTDAADGIPEDFPELPKGVTGGGVARAGLNALGGAIPFAGGLFAAAAGAWSEKEQARVNDFLRHWIEMLAAEMREKQRTILEIAARLDIQDEKIAKRLESEEYQALLRKAFRDWSGAESEAKRVWVRNLLINAASTAIVSDDVVRLFLKWINDYSELHFAVIKGIYNNAGITRGSVWESLNRGHVREDSADADLFKLIFRDLSTGGLIRQHRETNAAGQFVARNTRRPPAPRGAIRTLKSAFDEDEQYELTNLGQQFIHYAMTEVPPKLSFSVDADGDG
jgi:hypothetical protein